MATTTNDTPATFFARIAGAGLLAGDVAAITGRGARRIGYIESISIGGWSLAVGAAAKANFGV